MAFLSVAAASVTSMLSDVDEVSAQLVSLTEPGPQFHAPLAGSVDFDDAQQDLAEAARLLRRVRRILSGHLNGPLVGQITAVVQQWEQDGLPPQDAMTTIRGQALAYAYGCPDCGRVHEPWCAPYREALVPACAPIGGG